MPVPTSAIPMEIRGILDSVLQQIVDAARTVPEKINLPQSLRQLVGIIERDFGITIGADQIARRLRSLVPSGAPYKGAFTDAVGTLRRLGPATKGMSGGFVVQAMKKAGIPAGATTGVGAGAAVQAAAGAGAGAKAGGTLSKVGLGLGGAALAAFLATGVQRIRGEAAGIRGQAAAVEEMTEVQTPESLYHQAMLPGMQQQVQMGHQAILRQLMGEAGMGTQTTGSEMLIGG